ncbi:MAG: hypothetical protein H8E40_13530 [Chloroflexi bacterium]|nr:hypothetical protein [Chloroflexota bacterium]
MDHRGKTISTFEKAWGELISWCPEVTAEFDDIVQTVVKPDGSLILKHEDMNKLLLCRDQNKVGRSFFEYFFGGDPLTSVKQFEEGVRKFRVKALCVYGNFQNAFHSFRQREDLKQFIRVKGFEPHTEEEFLRGREEAPQLEDVDDKDRWMVGQDTVEARASEAREVAKKNMRKYLTWDYMDVYMATSMREPKDYQKMAKFVRGVFSHDLLKRLKLRYFDPTLYYTANMIDAGLLEGLMLKRARALVYHAGESDSFGKDSELAAMLAQGKPAIVYIEKVDHDDPGYKKLENRFEQFDQMHPLSLQIALNTGVANGVMVVRDLDKCGRLLYDVLLHQVTTELEEDDFSVRLRLAKSVYGSDSTIRVATKDTLLNRSFWNYYFPREHEDIPEEDGDP